MCRHEHELCKHDLRGLSKYKVNLHYFEPIRKATKEECEEHGLRYRNNIWVYKCRICGDTIICEKQSFENYLKVCKNSCNGAKRGKSSATVIGYNDIATTHPHKVKYFVNIEDAYTHSYASKDKVDLICPECGYIKQISIYVFIKYGFSCPYCSDNISYPEKVVALILKALGINFKKQHKIDGYGEYYYDFYLIDYNIIIEVHGEQHYREFNRHPSWKSYEDEHENDMIKYDIVVLNEYEYNKDFFIIDAKHSNIDYIKQSIYNCSLFQQFNLDNIDWQEIDIEAQKSIRIEICKYWKEQKEINKDLTATDIAKEFKIDRSVIRYYLKWGDERGICIYNAEEETKNNKTRLSNFVYLVKSDGIKWFEEAMSQKQLAKITGISINTVSRYTTSDKPLKAHHSAKYDPKYIGSYIVDADEWDSQHN